MKKSCYKPNVGQFDHQTEEEIYSTIKRLNLHLMSNRKTTFELFHVIGNLTSLTNHRAIDSMVFSFANRLLRQR